MSALCAPSRSVASPAWRVGTANTSERAKKCCHQRWIAALERRDKHKQQKNARRRQTLGPASQRWELRTKHPRRMRSVGGSVQCRASGGREPAALVVAADPDGLAAGLRAARAALPCRCVGILYAWPATRGLTMDYELTLRTFGPAEVPAPPELSTDAWVLSGGPEDAVLVGCDPSAGLLASIGAEACLCVVGFTHPGALGSDADSSAAVAAARRASIVGVPSLAVSSPSGGPPSSSTLAPLAAATKVLLRSVVRVISDPREQSSLSAAANCPRAHFPFPSQGRWTSLGSQQRPVDADLAASLSNGESEYAATDCWSLGDSILPGARDGNASCDDDPAGRRAILRAAFRDADIFLSVHVSPKWDGSAAQPFRSTRPGVLWHQDQVEVAATSHMSTQPVQPAADLWGRSLPVQRLSDAQPSSRGAIFVPQRNTEKVVTATGRAGLGGTGGCTPPSSFRIGKGTVLMDASVRGDVDAVLAGKASVTTMQTWPHGHTFSLLDQLMAETLREGSGGLPMWLTE
mmetsp:Transcript_45192/g.114407  ORF Transcript_45192/g.114407 Transcript_45192/m.114407 type:complete len:519 (-) Transcript_45192:40-1596(-)